MKEMMMRHYIPVFYLLFVFIGGILPAAAQEKPATAIGVVKDRGDVVSFTLTCSRPFITGNNRYMLYVGRQEFGRYEQAKKNGRGLLTFLIPKDKFNALANGSNIYLTYGRVEPDEQDMDELARNSRRCWSLGKFTHTLLRK